MILSGPKFKADLQTLLSVLGLEKAGNHCPCQFCGSSDGLSVFKRADEWFYNCHACDAKGDAANALALRDRISNTEAFKRLVGENKLTEYRPAPMRIKTPAPQVYANSELVKQARAWSEDLEHYADVREHLWRTRGISDHIAERFCLGATRIRRAAGRIASITWTFPILASERNRPVVGVKFHCSPKPERGPKCWWKPSGVQTAALLYPLLESQFLNPGDEVVLAAGELKALAHIECGIAATSRVAGESAPWPDDLARKFSGLRVVVDPDRENSDVARKFVANASIALSPYAKSIEVVA